MKKIIMIALFAFSANLLVAQNKNTSSAPPGQDKAQAALISEQNSKMQTNGTVSSSETQLANAKENERIAAEKAASVASQPKSVPPTAPAKSEDTPSGVKVQGTMSK